MRKLNLVIGMSCLIACLALLGGGVFVPRTLAFLDPVLCARGGQFNSLVRDYTDARGSHTSTTLVCETGTRAYDVTAKALGIMGGLVLLGALFLFWSVPTKQMGWITPIENAAVYGRPSKQSLAVSGDPATGFASMPSAVRLQGLKDAYDAGLMTRKEFFSKRQAIIREM